MFLMYSKIMTKCFQSQYFQMFMEYKQTFQTCLTAGRSSSARMTQPIRQPVANRDDSGRTDDSVWMGQTDWTWNSKWKRIGNCGLRTSQSDLVSESE